MDQLINHCRRDKNVHVKTEVVEIVASDILEVTPSDLPNPDDTLNEINNCETTDVKCDIRDVHLHEEFDVKHEPKVVYRESRLEKDNCLAKESGDKDSGSNKCSQSNSEKGEVPIQKTKKDNNKENTKQSGSSRKRKYTTNFQCYNCGYRTYDKSNLTKHIRTHSKIKQIKCQFCDKGFGVKRELDTHILHNHHDKFKEQKENLISYKLHKCEHCEYQTFNSVSLRNHMISRHALTDVETHKCYNCDYQTNIRKNLVVHIRKLHSRSGRQYRECDFCKRKFATKVGLSNHILKNHRDKMEKTQLSSVMGCKIFVCRKCPYESVTSKDMKDHMFTHGVIPDKPKLKCPMCTYETYFKNRLRKHEQMHGGVRSYSCPGCKQDFLRRTDMESHILSNHPQDDDLIATIKLNVYKCEHCDYKNLSSERIVQHMGKSPLTCKKFYSDLVNKNIEVKKLKLQCYTCGFVTLYRGKLVKHMRTHEIKTDEIYKCDHCDYKNKYWLIEQHMRKCPSACIKFTRGLQIKRKKIAQQRVRTRKRSEMGCHACGFVTLYRDNLIRHIRTHQRNNEMEPKKT